MLSMIVVERITINVITNVISLSCVWRLCGDARALRFELFPVDSMTLHHSLAGGERGARTNRTPL